MAPGDFPGWFGASVFGGLGCAVLSAIAIASWALLRRRGPSGQLAPALLVCLLASALDSAPIIWAQERLGVYGPGLGVAEVAAALLFTALIGWFAPLGAMVWYVLFAAPQSAPPTPAASGERVRNPSVPLMPDPARRRDALSGGAAWGALIAEPETAGPRQIALTHEAILIGRDPGADLSLADERVSRFHAELRWENGKVWLKDLDSLNGTRVNHLRASGRTLLRSGDTLQFAERAYRFMAGAPAVEGVEVETRKTAGVSGVFGSSLPPLALTWSDREGVERSWTLSAPVTGVGRDATCAVMIPDDSVSRTHALISRQPAGYFITDVESSNGVLVNGERVTGPLKLSGGDVILLGEATLIVRDASIGGAITPGRRSGLAEARDLPPSDATQPAIEPAIQMEAAGPPPEPPPLESDDHT